MKSITGQPSDISVPNQGRIQFAPGAEIRGPDASTPSSTPDAAALLKAFRRRWRLAIGLGVIGSVTVAALAWRFLPPNKYTVEALLSVEAEQPTLITPTKEFHSDPETDRRTQVALIKSLVLSKVVVQPEVAKLKSIQQQSDAAEWLDSQLKGEFKGKILSLSMSGDDPTEVTALVKAVTRTYLEEVANKEKLQRLDRNRSLVGHYEALEKKLESKRKLLRDLSAAVGSKDKQNLSVKQRLAVARQSNAEEQLLRVQSELKQAMVEIKVLQNREQSRSADAGEPVEPPAPMADADVEQAIQNDPDVQKFVEREQQLQAFIDNGSRVARNKSDPSIRNPKRELERIQKQHQAFVSHLRKDLRAHREGTSPELRQKAVSSLTALQDQIEVLVGVERELQEEVGKYSGDTQKLDDQALEMESIRTEIQSAEQMARLIGGELEVLKIELQAPDRVRLIKEAKAPMALDSSKQIKMTGMAGGATFGALLLLITFWEFRAQRIGSLDEVTRWLGIKVVGTVPVKPRNISRALPDPTSSREQLWQHQLMESVDATRVMLAHTARAQSLRVLLVTSAVGGEGKTSLSSHIATSLARSGQRTLLIDCDLRRPMVHQLYDQPPAPGFCELVRGELSADDVIRPTSLLNLSVITAGVYDEHALSVLARPDSRALFDQLLEKFDFIVVDSAPVLPVADTLLLGQHVDAALFSILRDVSQIPKIHAARERMTALGVPILGAVLSGTNPDTHYRY
jgi:polysaccharide biosynthesis transport protein